MNPRGRDAGKAVPPFSYFGERKRAAFPAHPRYARMLLAAGELGCVAEVCRIVGLAQGRDILFSVIKILVFALTVALIHCWYGMKVGGGPQAVGEATGTGIRASIVSIVVFLAFATAGLQKAAEEGVYHKLLVSRPILPSTRDMSASSPKMITA